VSKVTAMHRLSATRPRSGLLIDLSIAAVALGGTLAVQSHGFTVIPGSDPGSETLDAAGVVLAVCASVPLLAWRRSPLGAFAVAATAYVLLGGLGYAVGVPFGPTVALYLLAANRTDAHPWTPRTTAAVIVLLGAYLTATGLAQGRFPGSELFHTALAWGAAWFAGERTRLQRAHIAELRDRALRAEREAERERRLAVAEERARIARDLHDSAGHAINVIAVRAGAGRLGHHNHPDRSLEALAAIEEVARQTVDDIDHIVGTLRDATLPNGPTEAPPGLASVDTLVSHHLSTGLAVTVRTSGAPRALTGTVDQATYRILQEALTNASRHGAGTATIDLAFGHDALDLTVVNPVPRNGAAPSGGGHGLIGMSERATMAGGSLDAGRVNGAFRVRAHLPYGARPR
jgi:signal transduction histidine kinase